MLNRRIGLVVAAAALLVPLAAGCSSGSSSDAASASASPTHTATSADRDGRSAACEQFDRIATKIESEGPSADVKSQLEQIERLAKESGNEELARAAERMVALTDGSSEGEWYSTLGEMEQACRGQREN